MSESRKKPFVGGLIESSIDPLVYQDILKAYTKETISFPDYGNLSITNVNQQTIKRVQLTECEISPFHKIEIDCESFNQTSFNRMPSTITFSDRKILLPDIKQFLIHAFSPNEKNHRPYPSAGGLYPIEPLIFLFKERIEDATDFISGCYHFRAISKKLQLIKKMSANYFFDKLLHGFIEHHSIPAFGILYIAHIGKSIFKYRYRGYRHALMEAGSMYQEAVHASQEIGLRNTVWSTFSDHKILHALDLNMGTFMPLTIQLFGYGKNT